MKRTIFLSFIVSVLILSACSSLNNAKEQKNSVNSSNGITNNNAALEKKVGIFTRTMPEDSEAGILVTDDGKSLFVEAGNEKVDFTEYVGKRVQFEGKTKNDTTDEVTFVVQKASLVN